MRTVWINEDDAHFCATHPAADMTVAGLERLVDYYAEGTQVAGVLFCANLQKALYASDVWEPLWAGYDPDGGPNQPFLQMLAAREREIVPGDHARNWVHNLWLLEGKRGIDHLAVWLARCRHHGIEGWVTVRMNDAHGLKEYQQRLQGIGDYDSWCLLCLSKFWKEHPELRRAPYRWERSWEGALDYVHEAVRDHHLALIRELLERHNMDGLELDWLRWGLNFAPGHEEAGRRILTEFMWQVRRLADAAAARFGHRVKVGVRLPEEPQNALALGYDVLAWHKEGLVDQVVAGSMGGTANCNCPAELWRALLGDGVRLIAQCQDVAMPYPAFGTPVGGWDLWYGCADAALARAVDGLYLFNACYFETKEPERTRFHELISTMGDPATVRQRARRYVAGYPSMYAAGDSPRTVLPIRLRADAIGSDMGRMEENITVRVYVGQVPADERAILFLGFSPDTPPLDPAAMPVRVNGRVCTACTDTPPSALEVNRIEWALEFGDRIGQLLRFDIPAADVQARVNVVEFVPPQADGELRWAELAVAKRSE